MNQRHTLSLLAAVLLSAGCSGTYTITRTQADLQQAVARRFPITEEHMLVKVTLANPTVVLPTAERRIRVELDATIDPPLASPVQGRVTAMGEPWYDRASKSFFIRNPVVERVDFHGFDVASHEKVRTALSAVAARALEGTPVYTLQGRSEDERKAEMWLKEIYIKDQKLHLVLAP